MATRIELPGRDVAGGERLPATGHAGDGAPEKRLTDEELYAVYATTFDEVVQAARLTEARFLLEIGAGLARRPPPARRAALRAYCDAVRGGPKRSMRHLLAAVRAG